MRKQNYHSCIDLDYIIYSFLKKKRYQKSLANEYSMESYQRFPLNKKNKEQVKTTLLEILLHDLNTL